MAGYVPPVRMAMASVIAAVALLIQIVAIPRPVKNVPAQARARTSMGTATTSIPSTRNDAIHWCLLIGIVPDFGMPTVSSAIVAAVRTIRTVTTLRVCPIATAVTTRARPTAPPLPMNQAAMLYVLIGHVESGFSMMEPVTAGVVAKTLIV
jgi:hypothetical protein